MKSAGVFAIWAVVLALLVAMAVAMTESGQQYQREHCAKKWAFGGYATRYEPAIGCMVEVSPGRFVEERNLKIDLRGQQ